MLWVKKQGMPLGNMIFFLINFSKKQLLKTALRKGVE
jgi:hypothetical protein